MHQTFPLWKAIKDIYTVNKLWLISIENDVNFAQELKDVSDLCVVFTHIINYREKVLKVISDR